MSTQIFPLNGFLYGISGQKHVLLTYSTADWIVHASSLFNKSPLTKRVGDLVIDAFEMNPPLGLHEPTNEVVLDVFKSIHCDITTAGLNCLINQLQKQKGLLTIEKPLSMSLDIGVPYQPTLLTEHQVTLINLSKQISVPSPILSSAHKIQDLVRIFKDPAKALETYQTDVFHGSSKSISKNLVKKIGLYFNQKISEITQIAQSQECMVIRKIDEDITLFIHSTQSRVILYSLFNKFCWKGGYKQVYLASKFDHEITPIGISVTDDKKDFQKELIFRTKAELKSVMTPSYFKFNQGRYFYLGHGWGCVGTLGSVISAELEDRHRDSLALQLLEKVALFHKYAIHKDLHPGNLLVDFDGSRVILYINDFGTSEMKLDPKNTSEVITRSHNLSPEILQKIGPAHAFNWSKPFDSDLNIDDWEKSERFAVGMIITQLFLGYNPVFKLCDLKDLKEEFPLLLQSWKSISNIKLKGPAQLFLLDTYLDQENQKDLSEIYTRAFESLSITEKPSFDEFMTIQDSKSQLFNCFSTEDTKTFLEIYKEAHEKMLQDYADRSFAKKAQTMAELKTPVWDLLPKDLDKSVQERLDSIKELLDLDPKNRPELSVVYDKLHGVIKKTTSQD